MSTPDQRAAEAYTTATAGHSQRRDERLAASFTTSDQLERFAALLDEDRAAYDRLPLLVRTSVGHYIEQRAAAQRVQDADQ